MGAKPWLKWVVRFAEGLLFAIGLAGIPEDLKTWHRWLQSLDSDAARWIVVGIAFVLPLVTEKHFRRQAGAEASPSKAVSSRKEGNEILDTLGAVGCMVAVGVLPALLGLKCAAIWLEAPGRRPSAWVTSEIKIEVLPCTRASESHVTCTFLVKSKSDVKLEVSAENFLATDAQGAEYVATRVRVGGEPWSRSFRRIAWARTDLPFEVTFASRTPSATTEQFALVIAVVGIDSQPEQVRLTDVEVFPVELEPFR